MSMNEVVGNNIRKYRLAHNYTLKELSSLVYKSVSTLSKYEKGMIPINADTIEEFAKIFQITPAQLLTEPYRGKAKIEREGFLKNHFMFTYDGKRKRVLKSVIEEYSTSDPTSNSIQLFYDVENLDQFGKCKVIYSGLNKQFGPWHACYLQNVTQRMEEAWICSLDTLSQGNKKIGILSGISEATMSPCARKIIITQEPPKDSFLADELMFTKEEIQRIRKYNIFSIN